MARKIGSLILAVAALFVLATACQLPSETEGSLAISISDAVSRTIQPAISMVPASYLISGTGPDGASFSQETTSASLTIEQLAFGAWNIVVEARNAGGTAIGTGTGTAEVHSNQTTSVTIIVRPFEGFGTLSLNLSWNAGDVDLPQVEATLTPSNGSARTLGFTISGSTATFSASDLSSGYHTLVLKLLDNGTTVMGAVEVVRIVKDQTTSGSFVFDQLNGATGTLQINIKPEMNEPLTVSISGAAATKPANQTMNLSASIAETGVNATYVWYVNGAAAGTGGTFAFDDSWTLGYYRIDVTAFSTDGKRAGSATTNVQVTAAPANNNYISANIGTLIYVPAGSFQRDATATNISVITSAFRMSQYEITRAQFAAIMETDPSNPTYSSGTSDPVQQTNWYHAIAFCNKMSLAEGFTPVYSVTVGGTPIDFTTLTYAEIPTTGNADWDAVTATWTNNGYRLPTEMEWMWAAMGADTANPGATNTTGYSKAFAGSTGSNGIGDFAVFGYGSEQPGATTTARTNPVGSKTANELSIFDMSGNVWDWCWDWNGTRPTGTVVSDTAVGRGAASGTRRVQRGGSYGDDASYCTVTSRNLNDPSDQHYNVGFRVVRP